jgi:hypothetical protein
MYVLPSSGKALNPKVTKTRWHEEKEIDLAVPPRENYGRMLDQEVARIKPVWYKTRNPLI